MNTEKATALAQHLELNKTLPMVGYYNREEDQYNFARDCICEGYGESNFEIEGAEYKVLTDDEAEKGMKDYIEQSLFAFNADFLSSYTGLPVEVFTALQDQCEGANNAILSMIKQNGTFEDFCGEAVRCDGRGHFMGSYDGEEYEETINGTDYYIYRTN